MVFHFIQIVLPALLEQTQARTLLKSFVGIWCSVVGKTLNLERLVKAGNRTTPDVTIYTIKMFVCYWLLTQRCSTAGQLSHNRGYDLGNKPEDF